MLIKIIEKRILLNYSAKDIADATGLEIKSVNGIVTAALCRKGKDYAVRVPGEIEVTDEEGNEQVIEKEFVFDDRIHITLEEARKIVPNIEIGETIEEEVTPKDFGRIAAQTAKQVVVQRIREAEREIVYNEFMDKENEIVTGEVARVNKNIVYVNLGRIEAIMTQAEQIPGEHYQAGQKIKVYILEVKKTNKGPQIVVSRSHPGLVKRLFEFEVPEIFEGIVQIKSVSREAGSRTKMAVKSIDEKIDPIGACVGPKGSRVKNIVDELGDEKIDIIKYSDDPAEYISASLSPSKVEKVEVNEEEKSALVVVPDYQLSLAIGKEGQNARLAAKLTNWKIDIKSHTQYFADTEEDDINVAINPFQISVPEFLACSVTGESVEKDLNLFMFGADGKKIAGANFTVKLAAPEEAEKLQEAVDAIDPEKMFESIAGDMNGTVMPGWEPERMAKVKELFELYKDVDDEKLFENLKYFLERIMPTCDKYDINMAIHPDDPAWSVFGLPRIIINKDNILRMMKMVDNPHNGITFCSGSYGTNLENNLPEMIRSLKGRIHFAHVRNLRFNTPTDFEEAAHLSDDGSFDMYEIMKALYDIGFEGPIRPDHGRMIWGEVAMPGYGLYDRALGATYLNGLWEAITKSSSKQA